MNKRCKMREKKKKKPLKPLAFGPAEISISSALLHTSLHDI